MLKLSRAFAYLVSAILFGPILLALLSSPFGQLRSFGDATEAGHLLQTYDEAFPQPRPMYHLDTDYFFRQCGYHQQETIGNIADIDRNIWSPYEGFANLYYWFNRDFADEIANKREKQIEHRLSSFEIRFLNGCIANSALSIVCGWRVREILEEANLYSQYSLPGSIARPDEDRQLKVLCMFLDGVAARKGLKLGSPAAQSK